jgi:hypothetical protein
MLAKQALYHFSHTSSPFSLVILEMGVSLFAYFKLPTIAGMMGIDHPVQLFSVEMGVSQAFFARLT